MIIDCISDLHGDYPKLDGGDLLIIAGDLVAYGKESEYKEFNSWLCKQCYSKVVIIGGNQDRHLQKIRPDQRYFSAGVYLCDSGTEFAGIKIWGSPWTPTFYNWHFMLDRGAQIKEKWDLIPDDTDILITHGPPYGRLDETVKGDHVGCENLWGALRRVQPRLHVFGHIHEGHGRLDLKGIDHDVTLVNCSIMNERYEPVNKPIRVELDV